MKRYLLTRAAEDDLFEVWIYIAPNNVTAADQLEGSFFQAFQKLAERPDLGHFRRDLTDKPVRFFLVGHHYLIVYDPASTPLEVLRVLHGARDAAAELADL